MATLETEEILPAGTRAVELIAFNFSDPSNPDPVIRKGKFTLKIKHGILADDNSYRVAQKPISYMSEVETANMMADTITVSSGKDLTGADVAEALGLAIDKFWAGDYTPVA